MAETARLNIVVDPSQAIRGMDRLKGAMGKLKGAVFSLQSAFATLMGALAARDLIKTGEMFENIRKKIMNLTKDQSTANQLFQNTSKYATEVAFSFDDLFKATAKLTPILENSPEQVDKFLRITGDIAAQMGISAEEASTQMIKMLSAGAGAADRFREDGILAMLGFEAGVSYSADQTKKKLIEAFEDPAFVLNGVAKGMAQTYTGTLSMIGDKYMALKQSFNEGAEGGGFFTAVKAIAVGYNEFLDNNLSSAKDAFAEFGDSVGRGLVYVVTQGIRAIGGLLDAIAPIIAVAKGFARLIGTILGGFLEGFNALPPTIKTLGLFGSILMGPTFAIVLAAGTTILGLVDEIMSAIQSVINKIADFAQAAANILPKGAGQETAQNLAKGIRGFGEVFDPKRGDTTVEGQIKQLLKDMTSNGEGDDFLGSFLGGIDDVLFGGDAGLQTHYQDAANDLADGIEGAFARLTEETASAADTAKDGIQGLKKEMTDMEIAAQLAQEGVTKGAERYFANLGFTVENMADFTAKHLQGMEDAFVQFAMTGKLSFKGLINSMIADLARLMVQQLIMLPLKAALGFAEGGIMTDSGPMQLKKYARGGIANSPQVAVFGEGSQPEAYVPLPDGRTIPVTMDNKNGGGGGQVINISNHVDARGADSGVEERIRQAMQQSSEQTTANIQNLMRRGRFP